MKKVESVKLRKGKGKDIRKGREDIDRRKI